MENIKKLETDAEFNLLNENIENIVNDNIYEDGRDWTEDEIAMFVNQFQSFQETEESVIDMNKLDPNFISLDDFKKKFDGFDDNVLQYMVDCENKKLEDARIPPLIIKNENVTLTDSLSSVIYNGEKIGESATKPKTKCYTDSEDCAGGAQETESEEEEESI